MSPLTQTTHKIVCQCLQVTASEIESAAVFGGLQSLKDVMDQTGAGKGCTACHCAIRDLLGSQCCAPSSSPTWVTR